ncbi:MtrAB system histidine kinase MtrB [Ornithinimicrobium cerasi]|uniref:MtrAB system histidine kinase MtrB n=1 Tax=Ornithinimicrobium cerasi TaxID=2248773 RepID=UPI000EFDC224|nr:MtrAB system histidine kinase MtrB [Ornithinimicrobium cerasi]
MASVTGPVIPDGRPVAPPQGTASVGPPDIARVRPAATRAHPVRSGRSAVGRWWHSSLRTRVVTTTVLLGMAMGALLGSLLYQQIANGLVAQAVDSAQRDAAQQVALAQEAIDSTDRRDDSALNAAANDQVLSMAGTSAELGRQVLLLPALDNERGAIVQTIAVGVSADDLPVGLQEAIETDPENQQVVVVPVTLVDREDAITSVVVGSRMSLLRAGAYDLVLVYPMVREEETLDLVRQLFVAAGTGLVLLVGGLGWLATRMVTRPVERAAAVSQQLAAGHLDERLAVEGTDELAQLATSFNTMADSIQLQIRELRSLSQLQQRFVSDVSHELRTPLTTIRMAGEVLHASREDFAEPVARSAELLQQELDRFEGLLTELLEISRFDSGAVTVERHPEDLVTLVQDAVDGVRTLASEAGSPLEVRLPADGRPLPTLVDGRRVSRVLRNLLANAVEHGEGRPITVTVAATDQVVAVSVRDRGMGLDEEQQARVFDRFWRADPSRQRRTGGTGLGLAIALEDARVHGGWLQVSGRPGEGARFRLVLPRSLAYVIAEAPPLADPVSGEPIPDDQVPPVVLALATREELP